MRARQERVGDSSGVVGLLRPRLGALAEQHSKTLPRFLGADRIVARRRGRGAFLPFVERLPGAQPHRAPRVGRRQCGQYRRTPAPAGTLRGLGNRAGVRIGLLPELLQQRPRRGHQRDAGLRRAFGGLQPERRRQPARRRHAELRRPGKGEQLQQIERREPGHVEPPRGGAGVADHRRLVRETRLCLIRRQGLDLAVG